MASIDLPSPSIGTKIMNAMKKDKITIDVRSKPSIEDLKEIEKDERFCFKFNNKTKGAYMECHKDSEYYNEYYRTFGKPEMYGLYEINNETKTKRILCIL